MISRLVKTESIRIVEDFFNKHSFKYLSENTNSEITEKCDNCGLLCWYRCNKFPEYFIALPKDRYWGEIKSHYLSRLSCENIMIKNIIE